ncbi:MAG: ribonuclease P protein component [Candidatus Pacebacteria bacterium]|nr:ribonuclease P protein component [Candidatus Paceibacterota bacterium]
MLSKKERLNTKAFNRSFSVGARIHTQSFQCIYTRTADRKIAVVVPKKVVRHAVHRNKIRRRVYNGVRDVCRMYSCTGTFIFLAKPRIIERTYQEICTEIQTICKKVSAQ